MGATKQSIWREGVLFLWNGWEQIYNWLFQVKQIEPGNLFRLTAKEYRGPLLQLADGTQIRPGDRLGELHLANRELLVLQMAYSSKIRAVMAVKKRLKQDLHRLAELVAGGQIGEGMKAFYGVTLFHLGGQLLGFEVREFQPAILRHLLLCGQLLLLVVYSPSGLWRLREGHHAIVPKEIWLSRQALLRDFTSRRQNRQQTLTK